MGKEKRYREKQLKFRVTDQELATIKQRKEMMNFKSMEQYLRRVACGSPLYTITTTSIDNIASDVSGISQNINQIAKRVNATDTAYAEDLRQIKTAQEQLTEMIKQAFSSLLRIKD